MGLVSIIILVGIVFGALQLLAGIVIARYIPFGQRRRESSDQARAAQLRDLATRIQQLVTSVADDVDEHQTHIEQANQDLNSARAETSLPLDELVVDTMVRVVQVNERLKNRLSAAEKKLQQQSEEIESHISDARTDPLTGLPNRRAFDDDLTDRIATWRKTGVSFCLMIIDVDRFKEVNDRLGHPRGDEVLRRVAQLLSNTFRQIELPARIGGEEFAAILPGSSLNDAKRAAERIRRAVAEADLVVEDASLHVTISLGLAQIGDVEDGASLIGRADEALYASKKSGRNQTQFHNGRTCEPVDLDAEPSPMPPETPALEEAIQAEQQEMLSICDDLRSRLSEVAGEL